MSKANKILTPENTLKGYRLRRLEVLNWGTFDQKVWHLDFEGFSALLTGANGSGKSTLVDALLTLLVPNRKRNYNLSSGSDKRERTELTYVRGAYGRTQNEYNQGETLFLRGEDQFTVLLGSFVGTEQNSVLTLAQFFCSESGQLKKLFIASHNDLTIAEHFSQVRSVADLRARMRKLPTTEIFNKFTDYEDYFVKFFSFRSRKGLDLFNQVTTIKEIGKLNEFVRQNMLDAIDAPEQLDQLYGNYQHLTHAYQSILKAKRQIEELKPIEEMAAQLGEHKSQEQDQKRQLQILPLILTQHRLDILETERVKLEEKSTVLEAQVQQLTAEKAASQREEEELVIALSQEKGQQNLEKLDLSLKAMGERYKERHRRYEEYRALAEALGYKPAAQSERFGRLLTQAQQDLDGIAASIDSKYQEIYQHKAKERALTEQMQLMGQELTSLRGRKNRLPLELVSVREKIAQNLGVPLSELSYVAELVKVKDGEEKWAKALERLLNGFAKRLLVPEAHIKKINKYVRENNLGTRLVYEAVSSQEDELAPMPFNGRKPRGPAEHYEYIIDKIEFKPRLLGLTTWIKNRITRDFNLVCTEDPQTFAQVQRGITPEGLIKRGTQHEKDDRIKGEFRPILGWDNQDTLVNLAQTYKTVEKEHQELKNATKEAERNLALQETRRRQLQSLLSLRHFEDIDWTGPQNEISRLQELKDSLTKNGSKAHQLRSRLEGVRSAGLGLSQKRDELMSSLAVVKNQLDRTLSESSQARATLGQLTASAPQGPDHDLLVKNLLKDLDKRLGLKSKDQSLSTSHSPSLSLDKIQSVHQKYQESLAKKLQEIQVQIQSISLGIVSKLSQFKLQHDDLTSHLTSSIEALPGYLKIKADLDREGLPSHELRFRTLLNKSVVNDILAFKSSLEMSFEAIEESINHLNSSLKNIPYTADTHVQIGCAATRDVEIRDFQNMLRNAVSFGVSETAPLDLDESFLRVKGILDRLKNDDRWRSKVIDIRNWAEFFVVEKNSLDEQTNFYSDSAGLSGGQKAKLAFTILASAVAFQYGLYQDGPRSDTFRLVVIDEAFSKSDEKNSQYAMDLFTKLGLQLIVITPRDKLYVVEPYVNRVFLTQMGQDQRSVVNTILIDSFKPLDEALKSEDRKVPQNQRDSGLPPAPLKNSLAAKRQPLRGQHGLR